MVVISPAQAEKLLTNNITFSLLSFSMLVNRLKTIYEKNSSQENLQRCADEINAFLKRYGDMMGKDCASISKL